MGSQHSDLLGVGGLYGNTCTYNMIRIEQSHLYKHFELLKVLGMHRGQVLGCGEC